MKKNAERLNQLKAKLYSRQYDEHHHRSLTHTGEVKRQVEQDLAALSRRVWR